ncbi:MFS transporter [Alteromonas sp. a30]|uniref:MFS transporter n=1 Tax=Alteromonas sp. a30 TaxID=2730917 RepID=UPI0022831188|nr:MFS transporter [Alteromonas sp. a30]MCY7294560.1 MFS transporter [Alteromonas sp. a30]
MPWLVMSEFSINIARGIFTLAIGMLLYEQSESLWAFAFVFASEFFIGLFLQGLAGSLVDKIGPSKVLLTATFASSLVLGAPFLLTGDLNTVILIQIAICLNLFRPFIRNSVFVLTPELVEKSKLEKLNAYISMALQSGQIIGMGLAGLLLELFESVWTIYAVFWGYLGALIFYGLATLKHKRIQVQKGKAENQSKGSWKEALQFLRTHHHAVYLYLVATLDFMVLGLFNLLLAPAVKHNFDNLPRWLTFIDGAFAAGAILGGIFIAKRQFDGRQRLWLTTLSMAMVMSVFVGYALNWSVWLIMLFTFAFGILTTVSTVTWMSAQQRIAPSEIKGRLASVRYISNACFASIAVFIVSFANDVNLTLASFAAVACIGFMLSLAWMFNSSMESEPSPSTEPETSI